MAQILGQQLRRRSGHGHGLIFQRLPDPLTSAIYGGADANLGHIANQPVVWGDHFDISYLRHWRVLLQTGVLVEQTQFG